MVDLAFVTTNAGKFREARDVLAGYGHRVRRIARTLPEPQADDLDTVVTMKLAAVRDVAGTAFVEDSGLFIPSLGGFPGVYSAHFLRIWGFGPIFELLRSRARAAEFRAVVGLRSAGRVRYFRGACNGHISRRPRGTHGFGYDPIFVPTGFRRTFAEMSPGEKNVLSHRSRALRAMARFLSRPASRRGRRA